MRQFYFIISLTFFIGLNQSSAQFGALKNKIKQKLEKKVEDKLVEELSDHIAERAFRPIDKAMDDWFKETYKADTTETGEIDWEKFNARYDAMLANMNKEANLPDGYQFDLSLEVETKDYRGDEFKSKIHYMKGKPIFGYEQEGEKGEFQMVVMDGENDLLAVYKKEDGRNILQALPNVMSMANAFGASMNYTETEGEGMNMQQNQFSKTGKTKSFAGYKSSEYKGEDETEKYKFYVAQDFPVSWMDAYGEFTKNYMSANYSEMTEIAKGMIMYSESENKENKKMKSTWEVKKVDEKGFNIDNSEWEVRKLGE